MTTDIKLGNGIRLDRTPGTFDIPQSPYTSSLQLCRRMSADGGLWVITNVISGNSVKVVNTETCQYAILVMDARGGWWIGVKFGRVWLPDIDRTEKLAQSAPTDEPGCNHFFELAVETNAAGHEIETWYCKYCGIQAMDEQLAEFLEQFKDQQTCGNFYADEVAEMRNPAW